MAFQKVESTSSGSIPFFAEWVREQPEEYLDFLVGKLMSPKHVKAVQSGKGYLLNFNDEFMVFEWKSGVIGKLIKRMIMDEQGSILLLCFTKTKKSYGYELGTDDEVEVAVTEDKYDEGIYFIEATNELPPIAPSENRKFLSCIPMLESSKPVTFTATKSPRKNPSPRSDGKAI